MFATVLVANRGEIAVRVIGTLHAMGIRAVAVYSDADADALHVRMADEAVRLGPAAASQSYLRPELIIDAARRTGAQAVHPGYGFLSENVAFAAALADAGITFIGPPLAAIEAMGDKIRAKDLAISAGAPVVPGVHRPGMDDADLIAEAEGVGYPLMVKASAGGGGKGMRVVTDPAGLAEAIAAARREALGGFGDDTLMLERFVQRPRHIEIQVLADTHGTTLWVGERECSLQRRHQKVIEECPSPALDDATRQRMGQAAVAIAERVGYVGAGTVEFITDADATEFFFLEMNTRLQVEHPVTEEVYGLDLVEAQIRIAAGQPLAVAQTDLVPEGHAVEARIYAEDPANGFLPTGGEIVRFDTPGDVRVDTGVTRGSAVTADYDPMVAKIIAHGADREQALARLDRALADTTLFGFASNIAFLRRLLAEPAVREGALHTGLVGELDLSPDPVPVEVNAAVALATIARRQMTAPDSPFDIPGGWRLGEPGWTRWRLRPAGGGDVIDTRVRVGPDGPEVAVGEGDPMPAAVTLRGSVLQVDLPVGRCTYVVDLAEDRAWIGRGGQAWLLHEEDLATASRTGGGGAASGILLAPMPGSVVVVSAGVGDAVTAGQTLVVVEAMKMEHPLSAPFDGVVSSVHVVAGQQVAMEAPLVEVAPVAEATPVDSALR
ncbi:MAG TPA: biotin carboxylase N-terminal domain-containing protein [Euzebya sp.]|nr:biotin carboxylase N-terminal domain-containing protein [Euzebya sp.]